MVFKDVGIVLLISKDRTVKTQFRNITKNLKDISLIIDNRIQDCPLYPCTKVIFLDTSHFDLKKLELSLNILKDKYLAVPVFIIVGKTPDEKESSYFISNSIINRTPFLVIQKPVREITVKSILSKYTNTLRDRGSLDCKKHHALTVNIDQQYATWENCKIFLSQKECLLLSLLVDRAKEDNPLKCKELKNGLSNIIGQDVSEKCIRICIHRIRKKFKEQVGLDIIKNRYGVGYYIAV